MVPPGVGEIPHDGLVLLLPRHRGPARVEGEVNMPEGIPISTDKTCPARFTGKAEPEITEGGADLEARLPFPLEDVFPEDDESERKLFPRPRGLWIAAATFVPTFLAVFFGVPYLLGGATYTHTAGTRRPPGPVVASAPLTSEPDATVASPLPEAARGGTTDGRIGFRAQPPASDLSATPARLLIQPPVESTHEAKPEDLAVEPAEPSVAGPSLPPVEVRVPAPVRRGPMTRATVEARPAPEPRKIGAGDWKPAAAFADREAAGRLAGSIERQGYPVEIRQDRSSPRPWVVWISSQPRSGERRR